MHIYPRSYGQPYPFTRKALALVLSVPLLATQGNTAQAAAQQSAQDHETIEEIIVRATFRETSLMQAPASISVFNAAQLRARNARHLEEMLSAAPNVNFASGAARSRFLQIRGVGDLEQFADPKQFASVGITIDGIDLGDTAQASTLFDIEQVEILRGPQGTRFGTNASAGMINITSNAPTEETEGSVEAGVGNYGRWHLGAVLSGALNDNLLGRVAIQQSKSDGFIENDFLGRDDTGEIDELTLRAKLRWHLNDRQTLDSTVFHVDADNGYDLWSLDNNRHTLSDEPGRDQQEILALAIEHRWLLREAAQLQSRLTWMDSDLSYDFDADWTNPVCCAGAWPGRDIYERERQSYSVDLRLLLGAETLNSGDMRTVLGVYAQTRDEDLERDYFGFPFGSHYETSRTALYGELEWALSETLSLTTGMRFDHTEGDFEDSNSSPIDIDDDIWMGEMTLEKLWGTSSLVYATISRGNKPNGINADARTQGPGLVNASYRNLLAAQVTFDTETLTNYELGLKGRYLDDRLSLRAALFHMDRQQAQLENWVVEGFTWVGYLDSNGDADIVGAEIETSYQWGIATWFASLGYLDAELKDLEIYDLDADAVIDKSDRELAKAPSYQYTLGVDLTVTEQISTHLEVEGKGENYFGYYHDQKLDGYNLIHASVSYRLGPLSLQFWGNNLGNKDYAVHGLYFGVDPRPGVGNWANLPYYQFGNPRTYGVSAKYDF